MNGFNGSNFAEASHRLDHASGDDPLVGIARAFVEGDMSLALARLEQDAVGEEDDPAVFRFKKRIQFIALLESGEVDTAIDFAREAVLKYPEFTSVRILWAQVLAVAAQGEQLDGNRRRHLAALGMKLSLEARDKIREWNGPSGPSVAVALKCAFLLNNLEAACRLAVRGPVGDATDHESSHPDVLSLFARALGMLGRFEELQELDASSLGKFDQTLVEAWLARQRGDATAIEQMRRALRLAEDDEQRSAALYGLALLGGSDDLAEITSLQQRPSQAALLSSLAALETGDLDEALNAIGSHRWDSDVHALQFACVLVERRDIDEAVSHLEMASTRFSAPEFLGRAAALLMEESRLEDAESMVAAGLAKTDRPTHRKYFLAQGVELADRRNDWSEMYQRADSAATEFRDDARFRWSAILALSRLGDLHRAYRYWREHRVEAFNRQSLLIEVVLRSQHEVSLETVDWLLDQAVTHPSDEEFTAAILASIFQICQKLELGDGQSARVRSLFGGFVNEFPFSELLSVVEAPDTEALIEDLRARLEAGAVQRAELAEKVSQGQMPVGMLQVATGRPYALILVAGGAGVLVAVSFDEEIRRQELLAAMEALNNPVAIDTSSIMLWKRHLDGSPALLCQFSEVYVGTELLADLRAAEQEVRRAVAGWVGFDPASGGMWMSDADPQQSQEIEDEIREFLSLAGTCAVVESSSLVMPDHEDVPSKLAPWDAGFRVARSKGCALWTDDAVMRALARHYGVPAFGTYALYIALMSTRAATDLPSDLDFKRSLIGGRIADVPLTWAELEVISNEGRLDHVSFLLERPSTWVHPDWTLRWFRQSIARLGDRGRTTEGPTLLFAATLGACRTRGEEDPRRVAGALLADALFTGLPLDLVPELVAASRAACRRLTLNSESDPLPDAASILARVVTQEFPNPDGGFVGQFVTGIFSGLEDADRRIVASAILHANLE